MRCPLEDCFKGSSFSLHMICLAISSKLAAWVKTGARGRGPWNNCHLSLLKQKELYESVNAGGNKYRDCLCIYERYERQSENEKLWLQEYLEDRRVSYTCLLAMYVVVHACESVCGSARTQTHKHMHGYSNFQSCWNMSCIFCSLTYRTAYAISILLYESARLHEHVFSPVPQDTDSSNVYENSHVVISVICSIFV